MRYFNLIFIVFPVIIGGFIYVLFRPTHLLLFAWFDWLGLTEAIITIRKLSSPFNNHISGFILYSLPTMLWTFSFAYTVGVLWEKPDEKYFRTLALALVFFTSLFSEISQAFEILPGVFDFSDLYANIIGFFMAFIFQLLFRRFNV